MSLLTRKTIILAKIESAYGTDPTPTGAANAILCSEPEVTPLEAEYASRDLVRSYIGASEQLPGIAKVACRFSVEISGSGAAGTAPAYGPLLRACGFDETITGGVSVAYAPVSASFESITIYYNRDGVLHELNGCRGTVTLNLEVGQIPRYEFEFTGIHVAPTDVALPTPTYSGFVTPLPVNRVNTPTFSLHSYSGIMQTLNLQAGNEVAHHSFVGASNDEVMITNRSAAGSIVMESVLVATKDWFGIAKAGTTGALSLVHGTAAGNIVTLAAPAVQITNPNYGDADGVSMLNADLVLMPSSGNDELTITLT